jgi:AsmA protein
MKRVIRVAGIVAIVLILIAVALPFLVNANQFRPRLESTLSTALGRQVKVGDLKLALFSGGITANDLSVADDPGFSSTPFVHAKELKLTVELWPLVTARKVNVTGLTIDTPEIALIQSDSGTWNFSGLGAKTATPAPAASGGTSPRAGGAPPGGTTSAAPPPAKTSELDLSVKLVKITGGRLSIGQVGSSAKPTVFGNVNVEIQNFSPASVFPFSLSSTIMSGGDVHLDGKAGPLDPVDLAGTPVEIALKATSINLAAGGFVGSASGIDGVLSIDGSGNSNGKNLQWKGKIKLEKAKLARRGTPSRKPLQLDFALQHDLRQHSGMLSQGDIHVGQALAHLTGTYTQRGDSTTLNMRLAGPNMPVSELVEMLPPLDIVLPAGSSLQGGAVAVNVTVTGPANGLVTAGALGVTNTTLTGFDLGTKLSTIGQLAGINSSPNTQIQTASAVLRAAPAGIDVTELKLIVPAIGNLEGVGKITASHDLDFKMRAALHSNAALASIGQRHDTNIPFFIQGTSSNPVFKPDVKGIVSSEINRLAGSQLKDKGDLGKAAGDLLGGFLGGKKKK